MKIVKLTRDVPPNAKNEVCGFPDKRAQELVASGAANWWNGDGAPVAPPPPAPVAKPEAGSWQEAEGEEEPDVAPPTPPAAIPEGWRKQAPAPKK